MESIPLTYIPSNNSSNGLSVVLFILFILALAIAIAFIYLYYQERKKLNQNIAITPITPISPVGPITPITPISPSPVSPITPSPIMPIVPINNPKIIYNDLCNQQNTPCHELIFINNCSSTIFIGALGNAQMAPPAKGGWRLDPGHENAVGVMIPRSWGGRFWARTDCDSNGQNCSTGDCGNLQCNGKGGQPNVTVVEFTFDSGPNQNLDFYDVSNVDAYNMAIKVQPIPGTYTIRDSNNIYDCGTPGCTNQVNLSQCPNVLQVKNSLGQIVACLSPCQKINTDQVCCRGQYRSHQTCITANWPTPYNQYPLLVKNACPSAYSYPYDDPTSTFSCQSASTTNLTGYVISFCSTT